MGSTEDLAGKKRSLSLESILLGQYRTGYWVPILQKFESSTTREVSEIHLCTCCSSPPAYRTLLYPTKQKSSYWPTEQLRQYYPRKL